MSKKVKICPEFTIEKDGSYCSKDCPFLSKTIIGSFYCRLFECVLNLRADLLFRCNSCIKAKELK